MVKQAQNFISGKQKPPFIERHMPFATLISYAKLTSQLRQKVVSCHSDPLLKPEFLPTPCMRENVTQFVCT